MGWPICHSLSPRLHQYWLEHYAIKGSYEALRVAPPGLAGALDTLRAGGFTGVNLTVPHKEAAFTYIKDRDDASTRIGAVNLVTVDADGHLQGRNTDAFGFTENLRAHSFLPTHGTAFLLGAGGAARAILVALADMGFSQIWITNRGAARAKALAALFARPTCRITAVPWQDAPRYLADIDLLINATSLGMQGQPVLDLPLESLSPRATVTDIVYAPLETALLRHGRAREHRTIDGLGMLLHQARPSFAAFFGRDPEVTNDLRDYMLANQG